MKKVRTSQFLINGIQIPFITTNKKKFSYKAKTQLPKFKFRKIG
jgi:hypothetical protein